MTDQEIVTMIRVERDVLREIMADQERELVDLVDPVHAQVRKAYRVYGRP